MAESAGIQRVSHTHNAILDYMLSNPGVSLGEIAKSFGYTQPWLSCIIHSDAFQSLMKDKQGVIFHETVIPLREKMMGIAAQGLQRIAERLPLETDLSVVAKTTVDVLDRLGFGSKGGNTFIMNQTNNTQVNTLKSELDDARALLGKAERPQIGVVIDDSGKQPALPDKSKTSVGETDPRVVASFPATGGKDTSAEEGFEA